MCKFKFYRIASDEMHSGGWCKAAKAEASLRLGTLFLPCQRGMGKKRGMIKNTGNKSQWPIIIAI